jgi:RecA-family ATPase
VIDPIYKVTTGDENNAEAMSYFCNQFDKICTELGCAVIDCHHHSKGQQGQKKADDRASGSGVFRRDPDANIDMIELDCTDAKAQLINNRVCFEIQKYLNECGIDWVDEIGEDDSYVEKKFEPLAAKLLNRSQVDEMHHRMMSARTACERATGWRVEGSLREFASFKPIELWFEYPVHKVEDSLLMDAKNDGEEVPWQKKKGDKKKAAEDRKEERREEFFSVLDTLGDNPTKQNFMDSSGMSQRTLNARMKEFGYCSKHGIIAPKEDEI